MTFREVMRKLGMWDKAQRDTYKVLAQMTDSELKDIGLCRGNINSLIREMAGKDYTKGKDE